MLSDYSSGKLDTTSRQFKVITGIASILALTIPVFGFRPIQGQILTQVFNVFVLPIVVIGFLVLANRKSLGEYKIGPVLNIILIIALVFSVIISYNGLIGIIELIKS